MSFKRPSIGPELGPSRKSFGSDFIPSKGSSMKSAKTNLIENENLVQKSIDKLYLQSTKALLERLENEKFLTDKQSLINQKFYQLQKYGMKPLKKFKTQYVITRDKDLLDEGSQINIFQDGTIIEQIKPDIEELNLFKKLFLKETDQFYKEQKRTLDNSLDENSIDIYTTVETKIEKIKKNYEVKTNKLIDDTFDDKTNKLIDDTFDDVYAIVETKIERIKKNQEYKSNLQFQQQQSQDQILTNDETISNEARDLYFKIQQFAQAILKIDEEIINEDSLTNYIKPNLDDLMLIEQLFKRARQNYKELILNSEIELKQQQIEFYQHINQIDENTDQEIVEIIKEINKLANIMNKENEFQRKQTSIVV